MEVVTYQKVYSLPAEALDNFNNSETENFIFQGSQNWNLYFETSFKNDEISEFNNVTLLKFTQIREFEDYLKTNKIIDCSIEHFSNLGKYFVLVANNG